MFDMSEGTRPRRARRRQRSRRKREQTTVDRIAPGRVPVGFCAAEIGEITPCFGDNKRPAVQRSEGLESFSTLSFSHQYVPPDGSPTSSCSFTLSRALAASSSDPSSPSLRQVPISFPPARKSTDLSTHSPSPPPQRPLASPSDPQSCKAYFGPLLESAAAISYLQLSLANCIGSSKGTLVVAPPPSATSAPFTLEMATGPSLTSQARAAELNAATAARARFRSGELCDVSELASSRPVSLGALSSKNNSRNRGSKLWKPFPLSDVDESFDQAAPESDENREPPTQPRNHILPSASMETPQSMITHHPLATTMASLPLHHSSQLDFRNMENRSWLHGMGNLIQMNPLGRFGILEDMGNNFMPQRYAMVPSDSKNRDVERPLRPQDISPSKQEEKINSRGFERNKFFQRDGSFISAHQPYQYSQNFHITAEASHLKGPGPEIVDQFTYHRPPCRQVEYPNPTEMQTPLRDDSDPYQGIRPPVRPHDRLIVDPRFSRRMTMNQIMSVDRPQPRTFVASTPQHNTFTPSHNITKATSPDIERHYASNKLWSDARHKMTAYLNDVVDDSTFDKGQNTLDDPFALATASGNEEPEVAEHGTSMSLLRDNPDAMGDHENSIFRYQSSRLAALSKVSSLETQKEFQQGLKFRSKRMILSSDIPKKLRKRPGGLDVTDEERADGSVTRPPPGLPPPGLGRPQNPAPWESISPSSNPTTFATEKMRELNHWFHADGRGEETFRHEVLAIAQEEATRRKAFHGPAQSTEDSLFEPNTLLIGNIIANLRSYVVGDRKAQAGNFANFGPLPYQYCEASHGGRRSYFDNDPSASQWRIPTGRAFHEFSYRPTERFINNPFARSPVFRR